MSRSARSAEASASPSPGMRAGAASSPWSVPIWVIRSSSGAPPRSSTRRRPRIAEALYAFTFAFGGAPESFVSGPVPPSIRFMPH